jgi:uncharacterized protein (TIGR00255 family)
MFVYEKISERCAFSIKNFPERQQPDALLESPANYSQRDSTMITSMTAFARASTQFDWGNVIWEMRSVNHRYLDVSFKMPEAQRGMEMELRERMREHIGRGKVECSLRLQRHGGGAQGLVINQAVLQQLISACRDIEKQIGDIGRPNPLALLQWPGVLNESDDNDVVHASVLAVFDEALQQLTESRLREGKKLAELIDQRIATVGEITGAVRAQMPAIMAAQQQKLRDRLAELKTELDVSRLEQELVYMAQRADVAEELDRLDTHVNEVRRVLKKGGACGRRLDFLMQELNREANTLSSKSQVTDTTQAAVDLKVLIEQMREQVQNIE